MTPSLRSGGWTVVVSVALLATAPACKNRDRPMGYPDGAGPTDGGVIPMVDGAPPPMRDGGGGTGCIDETYTEMLPLATAPIDDLVAGYSGDYQTFVNEVLERRYPLGAHIVRGGRMSEVFPQDCVETFLGGATGSASQVIDQLGTVVHECGHFYDLDLGGFSSDVYAIRQDLVISCSMGDASDRGGQTFARSRLNGDDQAAQRPPCGGGSGGCDSYADVYLDGNPDDAEFQGGDQGFNMVIEEASQYVNSLATAYAYSDRLPPFGGTSARDGILTFLWYIERYLRLARTSYPSAYSFLLGDACWREAILTIWGRAWLYLDVTEGIASLGIEDDAILALVNDPELLAEIDAVRSAHCP